MRLITWFLVAVVYPLAAAAVSSGVARSVLGEPKRVGLLVFESFALSFFVLGWVSHHLQWKAWLNGRPLSETLLRLLLLVFPFTLCSGAGLAAYKLATLGGAAKERGIAAAVLTIGAFFVISLLCGEKPRHVRGTRLLGLKQARARAAKLRHRLDPGAFHGGVRVASSLLSFLILGAAGSGKSVLLRALMRAYLGRIRYFDGRGLVYDAKRDSLRFLDSLGMGCPIFTLNPRDSRCYSWDIARDVRDGTDAQTVAAVLIPEDPNTPDKFWENGARDIVQGVMEVFIEKRPGQWSLRSLVYTLLSAERIQAVLSQTEDGRDLIQSYLSGDKVREGIVSTLSSHIRKYRYVAVAWHRAEKAGRKVSLEEWTRGNFVLVLGASHKARPAVQALNRIIFHRASQLLLEESDIDQEKLLLPGSRRTFIFLDELRHAGELRGLNELFVEGRSKGTILFVGLQDVRGLQQVYGDKVADEQISQAANIAILRLQNEETAERASKIIGQVEVRRNKRSVSRDFLGIKRGVSDAPEQLIVQAVLPSEIMRLPSAGPANGVPGFFINPDIGVWEGPVPWKEVMEASKGTKREDLMENFVPWADNEPLRFEGWSKEEREAFGVPLLFLVPSREPGQGRQQQPERRVDIQIVK